MTYQYLDHGMPLPAMLSAVLRAGVVDPGMQVDDPARRFGQTRTAGRGAGLPDDWMQDARA